MDITGVLDLFDVQENLLNEAFDAEGYSTACVGKITIA